MDYIKKKIIFKQRIGSGGISETLVDIRRIFHTALEKNAVAIAVAHNHPTGVVEPSKTDIRLTENIKNAGEILKIPLLDHIIVGIDDNNKPDYYSFFENNKL